MGWLTRRRQAASAEGAWEHEPESYAEIYADDADMDDQGQVSQVVYRSSFVREGAPGRITVAAYVVYAKNDSYEIGFRYDYTDRNHPEWSYTGWTEDHDNGEVFHTLGNANRHAAQTASRLAECDPGLVAALNEIFEWDGFPW